MRTVDPGRRESGAVELLVELAQSAQRAVDSVYIRKEVKIVGQGLGNQVFHIQSREGSRQMERGSLGAMTDIHLEEFALHL